MKKFLKLLIYHLESLDGQRGTSINMKNHLLQREIKMRMKEGEKLSQFDIEYAQRAIAHNVMNQAATKYSVMRFRMKMSYICYDRGMTIVELWIKQILKTLKFL